MEQRPKVVRDIVVICVVMHNIQRTHQGRQDRAPTPGDDTAAIGNEPVAYVSDENCSNHF